MEHRILIAKEPNDCREALQLLLRLWGHNVCAVGNGAAAVCEALAWKPDVAIIDMALPSPGGYEVARKLRSSLCDSLLIALTGFCPPSERDLAFEAGFDILLNTPVDPIVFRHLLSKPTALVRAAAPLVRQSQEVRNAFLATNQRTAPLAPDEIGDLKAYQMRFAEGYIRVFEKAQGLTLFRAGSPAPAPDQLCICLNQEVERWLCKHKPAILPSRCRSAARGRR